MQIISLKLLTFLLKLLLVTGIYAYVKVNCRNKTNPMASFTEDNATVTLGNPVDLVTSDVAMDTKSVQVLAMSYMMYKIGKHKSFS